MTEDQPMTGSGYRAHRKRLDLTRADFAAALGLSPMTARRYEKGLAPIPLTVRLAIAALAHGVLPAADPEREAA